ncbi:uncharacterized protein tp53i13 [Halichoeres trimaculatus]|uniref:uncharacterized protein tp53i13 n=1 Tax=Halichoeres trimaculatus TaxID=147232 RepID=UPI003D9F1956
MPSRLTETLLVALCVVWVIRVVSGSLSPQCDNGKLSLEKDLPARGVYWDCPEMLWPGSAQGSPRIIDTWYDPEPAEQMCMDRSISYNHTIPNSGAFRPVRAESGEYFYCPPQRWLNNLHDAAIVFLYHPCAPLHERLLLSALAQSCLPDYIITPHKGLSVHTPIALVSWGRTLELSTSATLEVCDWLEMTASTENKPADLSRSRNYNLFLTRSAETHRKRSAEFKELLRLCCEQTISSLLNTPFTEPQVENTPIPKTDNLKRLKGKTRHSREITRKQRTNMDKDKKENIVCVSQFLSGQTNTTLIGGAQNNCTVGSLKDLPPESRNLLDMPETESRTGSFSSGHPEFKKVLNNRQKGIWKLQKVERRSPVRSDFPVGTVNSEHNHTTNNSIPENMSISSKDEGADSNKLRHKDSARHPMGHSDYQEKSSGRNTSTDDLMDNDTVDVNERELKQQQTLSDFDLAEANTAFAYKGLSRNDQALWAASALGFLLVLLTLSVLHTRLYRHWRTSPSVYWHDPKQDYDTVADVIRRRIQIAKRRLKRGRRKECVFLPSSSSSDEHP